MTTKPEPHAFGTFANKNAEVLIIGTFPSHARNRSFDFYYPNKNNAFWKIIETVYVYRFQNNVGSAAVDERKLFATERKIALTDMMAAAIREKNGSGDDQLSSTELTDINAILESCKAINRIVLTSRSGKINALLLFKKYLESNKIPFFYNDAESVGKGFFDFAGRKISVFVPYSPSPRVVRKFGLDAITDMYGISLLSETAIR